MFYSYDSVALTLTNTIPMIRHVGLCQKLFSQIQLLMFKVMGDAENARHEIAGHENAAPCCTGEKRET